MNAVIEKPPPRNRAGGPGEAAHNDYALSVITPSPEKLKWKRALELALDAVVEAESGGLGLIARNLVCRIELPERDIKFRAPFRPDQAPSCTIFHDRVIDWSTGERIDSIEFYALAKQVTTKQAIGELARHLGLNGDRPTGPIRKRAPFDKGTQADADRLIEVRGFSAEGIKGLPVTEVCCASAEYVAYDHG